MCKHNRWQLGMQALPPCGAHTSCNASSCSKATKALLLAAHVFGAGMCSIAPAATFQLSAEWMRSMMAVGRAAWEQQTATAGTNTAVKAQNSVTCSD